MQPYEGLARIYDYLLSGVNYQEWSDYLEQIFEQYKIQPCRKIVDLACGTGNSTFPWVSKGYSASGVDISPEMLALARSKAAQQHLDIHFYEQDIRSLDLPFYADVAVLYQDGLNYLLTEDHVKRALTSIRSVLRPGGFFVFNLNQVEKLPTSTVPEISMLEDEGLTLIWESCFQPGKKIWQIKLTAFALADQGLYEKIKEEHMERSYSRDQLEPLFLQTGWQLKACFNAFTFTEPLPQDRNIFFILQRKD
jgi:SAM-dependent methyltransferase